MNSLLAQSLAAALERRTPPPFRVLDVLPAKYGFLFSIHAKQRRGIRTWQGLNRRKRLG